jgi:hypothetical protein
MRRLLVLALVLVCAAVPLSAATAAPPTPTDPAGHVGGIVPSHLDAHAHGAATRPNAGARFGSASNLVYHTGGAVLPTNHVYVIFWAPSATPHAPTGYTFAASTPVATTDAGYEALVSQFFGDVAHDSGSVKSNVYGIDTQYYQTLGGVTTAIQYTSNLQGSVVDTTPITTDGCTDAYTTDCVSDAQLQTELQAVMTANHWSGGVGTLYFLFTANGLGSCSGSSCAFAQYCAYHGYFSSSLGTVTYANMPYADTVPAACDEGQYPNTNTADATLNVTSHEHNEAITDPLLNAWYDRQGNEDGDKCAWTFGALAGTASAQYNQTINGHRYYLQQEWSNSGSACKQHL